MAELKIIPHSKTEYRQSGYQGVPAVYSKSIKENPSLLLTTLSGVERQVFEVLLRSKVALSPKGIQRAIAEQFLLEQRNLWVQKPAAFKLVFAKLPEPLPRTPQTLEETRSWLKSRSTNAILRLARSEGIKIEIPGEPTIKRALEQLESELLVEKRETSKENSEFIYYASLQARALGIRL